MTSTKTICACVALVVLVIGCEEPVVTPDLDGGDGADSGIDAAQADAGRDADQPDPECLAPDMDGDGEDSMACGGTDCDDGDPGRFPANAETCNTSDEDCDPTTYGERDLDGDGHDDEACCNPTATGPTCGDDCDDTLPGVHREAPEVCNGRDDDCDDAIDEAVLTRFFADCDFDGFGGAEMVMQCAAPTTPPTTCPGALWITVGGDCNDSRAASHPTATETCDLVDDDCDGMVDDGAAAWCVTSLPGTATATCTAGGCAVTSCATPQLDCSAAPGCETDGATDPEDCGACGTVCSYGCRASTCDDAVEIEAGGAHTCARRASGTVVCWGNNTQGELGDGTRMPRPRAAPVPGLTSVVEVSAGTRHTCVRHTGGTLSCWGSNQRGQLGNGATLTDSTTPVAVSGVSDAVEVEAGDIRSCARTSSGAVWCWGAGGPALGDGTTADRPLPGPVPGLTNAIAIAVGQNHACAVRSTGAVACWGVNTNGQLGNGTVTTSSVPVAVSGITTATDVVVGDGFSCALLSSGSVRCWGLNTRQQLGDGTTTTRTTPVTVDGPGDMRQIAAAPHGFGSGHVCGLNGDDGNVVCWGGNAFGQLGNGMTSASDGVGAAILRLATDIAAGGLHSCAIQQGSVWCWGSNGAGRLGDGTEVDQVRPQEALAP